jgi:hypothetical protein
LGVEDLGKQDLEHDAARGVGYHVHLVHHAAAELPDAALRYKLVHGRVCLLNGANCHVLAALVDWTCRFDTGVSLHLKGRQGGMDNENQQCEQRKTKKRKVVANEHIKAE